MTWLEIRIPRIRRQRALAFLIISTAFSAAAQSASVGRLVASNSAFALDLYAQLKSTSGNLFFSPYSISTCLAITYAGARGGTETQMARVLHFTKDQRELHSSFGELQRQLVGASQHAGIELAIANALWTQKGHPLLPDFLNLARGEYQANVNQADFKTEANAVADQINRWVAQRTRGKIENILSPGSLDGATRLVLANAIYFKGTWVKRFEKSETLALPFHVSTAMQVKSPLMHHVDYVRYMESSDLQAVELPYGNNQLAMVILLPREWEGCGRLESALTTVILDRIFSRMQTLPVEISLPRFKLESKFELSAKLAKMGMPDAFGAKADFSGIDETGLLYAAGLFHKAWGEVNEEGTEAAAATVATARYGGKHEPGPTIFRADHPFIFLIHDIRSGAILFLGRLVDPTT